MKKKIISTVKADLVVFECSDKAVLTDIHGDNDVVAVREKSNFLFTLPDGVWIQFESIMQITEEDWKGIVEDPISSHYINYGYSNAALKWVRTATESGLSLLKLNGINEKSLTTQIFVKIK